MSVIKDTIDKKLVKNIVIDGYIYWKMMRDIRPSQEEWKTLKNLSETYEIRLNLWEKLTPNTFVERLKPVKQLKYCKKLKFGNLFMNRLNLRVHKSFKFEDFNWVEIQLDKSDYEYGFKYYLKIDDTGKVSDWSEVYWIQ